MWYCTGATLGPGTILGYGEIDESLSTKLSSWIRTSSSNFEYLTVPLSSFKVRFDRTVGTLGLAKTARNKV